MYVCRKCQQPINSASEVCPYCGAEQTPPAVKAPPNPAKKRSATQVVIMFAVAIAGIWGIIWFATPMRMESPQPAAEQAAMNSLRTLQQELATYANGAGTFPQTLDTLGEPARAAAREAMRGGYTLRYTPGQSDAGGAVHTYGLVALPRNYGYRSYFTDQTGIIRSTRESRVATAQDAPI
jgi:hypothetical protein